MLDQIKKSVGQLLEQSRVRGFIGLIEETGQIRPYLFTHVDELDRLSPWTSEVSRRRQRKRVSRVSGVIPSIRCSIRLARAFPEETFSVFVRGCDERGLNEIFQMESAAPG